MREFTDLLIYPKHLRIETDYKKNRVPQKGSGSSVILAFYRRNRKNTTAAAARKRTSRIRTGKAPAFLAAGLLSKPSVPNEGGG